MTPAAPNTSNSINRPLSLSNSPNIRQPPSQLPPGLSSPTIDWLMEKVDEGESFLGAQPNYSLISTSIDSIMSMDEPNTANPKLSDTRTNRIAKIAEDLVALLTDTKPFWDYQVANRRFEQHAANYGKLSTFWFQQRNIDLRMADCYRYYTVGGTGFLHIFWNAEIGDFDALAEDPRNVLPIRPTNYDSCESCLGVIVKRKVPVNYIRDRYKIYVEADSDGTSTFMGRLRQSAEAIVSPIWRAQKTGGVSGDSSLPKLPTVTQYTCYLKDDAINKTSKTLYMGEWTAPDPSTGERQELSSWSYKVQPGEPIYPHRRMIIWVDQKILYDGPSYYWHANFPIIKITLNPWPWSWFGKAPVHDLLKLQRSVNKTLRVIDDHEEQVAQPGAIMDKTNVSRAMYQEFDTRKAGWKVYQNPLAGKGITIQPPPPLDPTILEHLRWKLDEMKDLAGVTDLSKMASLNQIPSNETIQAMINSLTPGLRMRSRIMEAITRTIAMQMAYNFTQFYTLPMRVTILGPGGVTQDDFDYDPGTLMPDFVHPEDYTSDGNIAPDAFIRGPFPRYSRAKEFLRRFAFKISPGSLLNAAQTEQKLIYLQLARAGWMDIFTLWEILGIPNIGVLPDNVRTIPERLQYQQTLGLTGDVSSSGRKASGQAPPRIVTKES